MQQHHLVSQRLNFTCPPVSAPARFKSDTPGGTLSQKCDQIVTANLRFAISPVWASTQYNWNTRFATSSPYVVAFIWGYMSASHLHKIRMFQR